MEGVENPYETVGGAEEAIPPLPEHHNPLGIVREDGSDVERVLVVNDQPEAQVVQDSRLINAFSARY